MPVCEYLFKRAYRCLSSFLRVNCCCNATSPLLVAPIEFTDKARSMLKSAECIEWNVSGVPAISAPHSKNQTSQENVDLSPDLRWLACHRKKLGTNQQG